MPARPGPGISPHVGASPKSGVTASIGGDAHALFRFLTRTRVVARRRELATAGVETALVLVGLCLAGVVVTTISGRGDVARGLAVGLAAIGSVAVVVRAVGRWRTAHGSLHATARTIAATAAPLRRRAERLTREVLAKDVALRQELLGAYELAASRSPSPTTAVDHAATSRSMRLGSPELAARYVEDVAQRLALARPEWAAPRARLRPRLLGVAGLLAALTLTTFIAPTAAAWPAFLAGEDTRPKPPPQPAWSQLELEITYPEHTGRTSRVISNPTGALRVPAGTRVRAVLRPSVEAASVVAIVTAIGATAAETPAPERVEFAALPTADGAPTDDAPARHVAEFTVVGQGSWQIVVEPKPGRGEVAPAPALPLEIETDQPPDVELVPLADDARAADSLEEVELRFRASDDFGLRSVELVWQLGDGAIERRTVGPVPEGRRVWRHHHAWDLSTIALEQRSELVYWLEVRDNDPGLGLTPLADPPGKVTRTPPQHLAVRDAEAEHAKNLADLRALRDVAVDVLAARLVSPAFAVTGDVSDLDRLVQARAVHGAAEGLVLALRDAMDAAAQDAFVRPRDAEILAGIHRRLADRLELETKLHDGVPDDVAWSQPAAVRKVLTALRKHNAGDVSALEDEIIRLDDLVDEQLIAQLERVVARLETAQRRLVELLEQLEAGDESVRGTIDQLRQRMREDMKRVDEVRSMMAKELGPEWMNLDAFEAMRKQMERMELQQRLDRGDVSGALEEERQRLEELRRMRGEVQRGAEQMMEEARLSPEEKARMTLLRELSRLQDEQAELRAESKALHQQWRDAVDERAASRAKDTGEAAKSLRESLEAINDARLGRDGRTGLLDAIEALEALEEKSESSAPSQLSLLDDADRALDGTKRAGAGAEPGSAEARALERAESAAASLRERLAKGLPSEPDILAPNGRPEPNTPAEGMPPGGETPGSEPAPGENPSGAEMGPGAGTEPGTGQTPDGTPDPNAVARKLDSLREQQRRLRERIADLMQTPEADVLPEEGVSALERAQSASERGESSLDDTRPGRAREEQDVVWRRIQDAIDSLRSQNPPPPPSGGGGEASTEAERDRSLRDEIVEAMRERAPEGFSEAVQEYYEELLR